MTKTKNTVEMHGCIVCGRIFNLLAVYTRDNRLVGCTVASPSGRRVPDERRPLVACNTHTTSEIETAYKKWQARKGRGLGSKSADE